MSYNEWAILAIIVVMVIVIVFMLYTLWRCLYPKRHTPVHPLYLPPPVPQLFLPEAPTETAVPVAEAPPHQYQYPSPSPDSDLLEEGITGFAELPDLGLRYGRRCNICYNTMDGYQSIYRVQPCDHSFHKKCIVTWFQTQFDNTGHYTCPVCQDAKPRSFVETKIITIRSPIPPPPTESPPPPPPLPHQVFGI